MVFQGLIYGISGFNLGPYFVWMKLIGGQSKTTTPQPGEMFSPQAQVRKENKQVVFFLVMTIVEIEASTYFVHLFTNFNFVQMPWFSFLAHQFDSFLWADPIELKNLSRRYTNKSVHVHF